MSVVRWAAARHYSVWVEGKQGHCGGWESPLQGGGGKSCTPKAPSRVPEPLTSSMEQLPLVVVISTFFSELSIAKARMARASCGEWGVGCACQEEPTGFRGG